ncbi:hypothetical protein [Parasphingorhabdus sp.]|uniref:hypothetical protein n=1 Tax=Parasphingorhabdus sp. TaxID=2709688 RepID=UPI0030016D1A
MNPEPPLLIIAPLTDGFDLAQLPWCEAARERISVNHAKFKNMEMVEVIVDAMPFLLSRLTAAETSQRFATARDQAPYRDLPSPGDSAIGIQLGDNLASARHLTDINRRLLLLGQWIGESLKASAAAWMPSRQVANIANYDEIVRQYLAGGRFPALFQTAFKEVRHGYFVTTGLHYFADQEICLTVPPNYRLADVTDQLVRIIADIATSGKIDRPTRSKGMVQGERLIYSTSDDLGHVDIVIRNDLVDTDLAKI